MPSRASRARRGAGWFMRRRHITASNRFRSSGRRLPGIEIWSRPVADRGGVRDEPEPVAPVMQLITGRLERKGEPRFGPEVERDLMRGARCCAGERASKAGFDRSVEMAAENPLDLRVVADDLGKPGAAAEPGLVHPADPGWKRRVRHQHHRGPILCRHEGGLDPLQPLRAQYSAALARYQGVERNDAQRVVVDRIIEYPW